jgi:hypothetical protein
MMVRASAGESGTVQVYAGIRMNGAWVTCGQQGERDPIQKNVTAFSACAGVVDGNPPLRNLTYGAKHVQAR